MLNECGDLKAALKRIVASKKLARKPSNKTIMRGYFHLVVEEGSGGGF